ncbi:hypothetical protein ACLBKU_00590 [Erythrobacter sp. NE805]|uniref:hypothetical protein n=1 Tax=Erythrobacter sp. NE805 TaxID=3389875 RepID=UPI00396B1A8D
MGLIERYELLSDAGQVAVIGAGLWALAAVFALMEWRRTRRRKRDLARLEAIGWVPWTGLFMLAALLGAGCLAMSLPVVLRG